MQRLRARRPSVAAVIALLALFVALGGTGVAAPAVDTAATLGSNVKKALKLGKSADKRAKRALKTARTADKNAKAALAKGGPKGDTGPPGPFPTTLPAGKTITGAYSMGDTAAAGNEASRGDISFVYPLASAPTGHYINVGAPSPAGCPGTASAPAADPGHLCIYEERATNVGARDLQSPTGLDGVTTPQGVALFVRSAAAGLYVSAGRWAVTGN